MRRLPALVIFAGLALMPLSPAQEPAGAPAKTAERGEPGIGWQWANFAILAGFLGYMIAKSAPKFFEARSTQIRAALSDAARAKRESDDRVAEMQRRIDSLSGEIETMRDEMRRAIEAEGERIRLETERHIRRIHEQAEQDIRSMIKMARRELQMDSAALALRLAEEQLSGRVTPDLENTLVNSFIADLRAKGAAGTSHN